MPYKQSIGRYELTNRLFTGHNLKGSTADETENFQSDNNDFGTDISKRILCLMSHTGGGHKASAQALKDGFECVFGNFLQIRTFSKLKKMHFLIQ